MANLDLWQRFESATGTSAWKNTGIDINDSFVKSSNGVTKELWRIEYESLSDYQRVWDFLAKTDKDADWEFAASKSFWEDFLAGKTDGQ